MLQFITNESDKYSIVEEAQMVINGGCRWVQLRMKDASDEEIISTAKALVPICQDSGTFLIIDDRVDLVNELKVSGVHLGKSDMDPLEARQILGAHAIIGVTANTAADILQWKGKDIDYVGLGPFRYTNTKKNISPIIGIEGYRSILSEVRAADVELPVVAIGGITLDDVDSIMTTGVNGIAVSGSIIKAADPTLYTTQLITKLKASI